MENNVNPQIYKEQPSCIKQILFFVVILFFLTGIGATIFVVYATSKTTNAAQQITAPIGNMLRQLASEATPVIMPDPITIVREINQLSNLETASYRLQKVIIAERNQDVLWGALGESLIFEAVGEVVAGIDLSEIEETDLQIVDPDTIIIHLPESKILHSALDNQQSRVIDRDKGILASVDPQLETQVRQEAEKQILEAAIGGNILQEADKNAQEAMQSFLNNLGFANVIFADEPPPPAPPFEQDVPKGTILTTPSP